MSTRPYEDIGLFYGGQLKNRIREGKDPLISRDHQEPLNVFPHYSDRQYEDPDNPFGRLERHLYLAPGYLIKYNGYAPTVPGAAYDYSDRIESWFDRARWRKAMAYADALRSERFSAAWFEDFLCALYMRRIKIVHIVAGIGINGYSYRVFGYE